MLPLVYLVAVSAILYALLSNWAYDDPFITYRYAHNLAHGLGFVYNPGERILSTTTPLFAILLALLNLAFADLPNVANLIGAVSLALGALFLWDLSRTYNMPIVGWTALLLYPTFTLPATTIGSETPIYIAFCLGTFAFYARQRYISAAALAALAALTRPDGVLVAVVLGIDYLLRVRQPIPWKAVIVYTGLLLPWFLFAWVYFGYPLPVTLAAKQQQGTMAISQTFATGIPWILGWYSGGWQYWAEAILGVMGLYWLARYARQWILIIAWTGLYFIAYSLLGVSRYFWYYAPLIPGFIIMVGLGITALFHALQLSCERITKRRAVNLDVASDTASSEAAESNSCRRLSYMLSGLLLISLTAAQVFDLWKLSTELDPRPIAYRAVGEWIETNTPPEAVVSSLEIGVIGYYADRRMVDFAGLLRPEVAQHLVNSVNYEDTAAWTVEKYSPDYVVLVKGDLRSLKQGYLQENCRVAEDFQSDTFGYGAFINVYACK